jgi:DNA-binding IclR family transcriptional regulator
VLDRLRQPVAVVSVWGAAPRIGERRIVELGPLAAASAGEIAAALDA